jgi:hypothetical protein
MAEGKGMGLIPQSRIHSPFACKRTADITLLLIVSRQISVMLK